MPVDCEHAIFDCKPLQLQIPRITEQERAITVRNQTIALLS